ncbi:MAG: hypothetical protein M1829_002755 [Trizodia sp. TS-e1964]|nr:MAG: hypothetical protein M1829_002755 [Trizodia sp. TS-e1964]
MPTYHTFRTSLSLSVQVPKPAPLCLSPNGQSASPKGTRQHFQDVVLPEEGFASKGSGMSFLGEKGDIPFFLVRAGRDFFQPPAQLDMSQWKLSKESFAETPTPPPISLAWAPSSAASSHFEAIVTPAEATSTSTSTISAQTAVSLSMREASLPINGSITLGESNKRRVGDKTSDSLSVLQSSECKIMPTQTLLNLPSSSLSEFNLNPIHPALNFSQIMQLAIRLYPSIWPQSPPIPFKALPLKLTLSLNPTSFLRYPGSAKDEDIAIFIFCNGEFTLSQLVTTRQRSGAIADKRLTLHFSGRRVALKFERKWIFVPYDQNADGSVRQVPRGKAAQVAHITAAEQWANIGGLLEAESRNWASQPVMKSCLESISKNPMPEELKQSQTKTGQKYGCLDVVLVLGNGRKEGANFPYLKEPSRMLDRTAIEKAQSPSKSPGIQLPTIPGNNPTASFENIVHRKVSQDSN